VKRLGRTTLYTESNALEARVAQLERRIITNFQATWAVVSTNTPQTIASGSSDFLAFDSFQTNSGAFTTTPDGTAGDTRLENLGFGVYVSVMTVEWEDIGVEYPHSSEIDKARQRGVALTTFGASAASASEQLWPIGGIGPLTEVLDTGDVHIGAHSPWDYLETQPATWGMLASNGHTADVDVIRAALAVTFLPNTDPRQETTNPVIY
jgi:hypothetical protein